MPASRRAFRSPPEPASGSSLDGSGLIELTGPSALDEGAAWLDHAHEVVGTSLLGRRASLQSWMGAFSGWESWLLAWIDGADEVRAVAPLARRRVRGGVEVIAIGDDALDESPLVACDDVAAHGLASGMAGALRSQRCRWRLCLRRLPVRCPLADALVQQLSPVVMFPDSRRPVLRFTDDRPPRGWLTRNVANALSKAQNRIAREGHALDVGWEPIDDRLPELLMIHRERDVDLRGATLLDDAQEAAFYQSVVMHHGSHWRLLTVRVDGSLAAYALCLHDGSTLRVWDNRVSPRYKRYSAGLIANAELVQRAAVDASVDAVDWGSGEQRYKTSLSNELVATNVLVAWSSSAVRTALAFRNRFDERVQRLRHVHSRV